MSRAQKIYESVLSIKMSELPMPESLGNMQMMSFPWVDNDKNISGALVKMDYMKPGAGGTLVYFACDDCSVEESRIENAGGKICSLKWRLVILDFTQS